MAVTGDSLTLSLEGGNSTGVRVGIAGDPERSPEACEPIRGGRTEAVVTWRGKGSDVSMLYGAVALELLIPTDAIVFAFGFRLTPLPVPSGIRLTCK